MKTKNIGKGRYAFTLRLRMLAGLLLFSQASSLEADVMRGSVYEDSNRNGVREEGEKGLAGVKVSNGIQIVVTDAAGRYEVEAGDDATIFVIKPRDYAVPVGTDRLPRFYRHHVPKGTQDAGYRFKGLAATGEMPASVDFPLIPKKEEDHYEVVLLADPQPYDTKELMWYAQDTLAEVQARKAAFGIVLGDLVGDNLALHEPYVETNAVAGYPWYNVIGNHDLNYDAPDDKDADSSFRRVFGPSSHAFQYGKVHYILLNNVEWGGRKMNDKNQVVRGNYRARLRPGQLAFVKAYLETVDKEELIVICTHIPMFGDEKGGAPILTPEFPELLGLLSGHPHSLSVSGHMHFTYSRYFGEESGYRTGTGARHLHVSAPAASGSWYAGPLDADDLPVTLQRDGSPHGYLLLQLQGNQYTLRFKGTRRPEEEQMRVQVPAVVSDPRHPGKIRVNFFLGNEDTRVLHFIDGKGDGRPLRRIRAIDTAYTGLRERTKAQAKPGGHRPLPEPVVTDHLWEAELPEGLEPGVHTVEVQVKDGKGAIQRASTVFRVLSSQDTWMRLDDTGTRRK